MTKGEQNGQHETRSVLNHLRFRTALEWFEWSGADAMNTSGLWRLLLAKTDREVDLENFKGSSEGFSYWQQNVDPLYYQRPFEERLGIAFSLARSFNPPDVVRLALSLGSLPPLTYAERGDLLIHVAKWAGAVVNAAVWGGSAWVFDSMFPDLNPRILILLANVLITFTAWRPFLRELIGNGAPLHYIDTFFYGTPLTALIRCSINVAYDPDDLEGASIYGRLYRSLSAWLESLQECGINLEEYGEKEIDLHDQGLVFWSFDYPWWKFTFVLTNLTYGPQPSDWKVTWIIQDRETPYIPGEWIGGDDDDDEDASLVDEDENDPAETEDEDGSIEEVYEDCSVGDEPEVSAQATRTE